MYKALVYNGISTTYQLANWCRISSINNMGVSKNRGTPKWMVYNGKPCQNGWFGGTTIFGNHHMANMYGKHVVDRCSYQRRLSAFHAATPSDLFFLKPLRASGSKVCSFCQLMRTEQTFQQNPWLTIPLNPGCLIGILINCPRLTLMVSWNPKYDAFRFGDWTSLAHHHLRIWQGRCLGLGFPPYWLVDKLIGILIMVDYNPHIAW